jgi:hypothetical protein
MLAVLAGQMCFAGGVGDFHGFIEKHCLECHDSDSEKGGLDLSVLKFEPQSRENFSRWVKVVDRVSAGEMPPKKKERPRPKELATFTNALSGLLLKSDQERISSEGRATRRRFNRYEYEETLRDLLMLPYLEVKSFLPEDTESFGFNKIGDALDVSHVQIGRYLAAAEFALKEAMAPQVEVPERLSKRFHTWDQHSFFGAIKLEGPLNRRTFPLVGYELQQDLMNMASPKRGTLDPGQSDSEALAVVVSTYEPTEIHFDRFRAPVSGKYRLRFCGYSVWFTPKFASAGPGRRSEPITIYADTPPRLLRKLGSFDVNPEPTVREMEVFLQAGETIRPDAARFFRSRPPDHKNPLEGPEGMPAVAFSWMDVEGPMVEQWPPRSHELLFGDLPLKSRKGKGVEVTSAEPEKDAAKLMRNFVQRAYRRPVDEAEQERFLKLVRNTLDDGHGFTESLLAGYMAVLSSPGFLYFSETPGKLNDRALANRLSYFLWNSPPDADLLQFAAKGDLHKRGILRAQTERMLGDPRSTRFAQAFLNYWLDLRLLEGTAPDTELYPDYQLDDLLVESMVDETRAYFLELIKRNASITNVIASDFAILNERLATHYGVPGVDGVSLRPVTLPNQSLRGGFLTQASVLKVTANGTTTSPVKRGAWVMTRLIGKPPQPPPPNIPALEPDTRGATTIREQLAKHRAQESCAACHRNIDPPGFALESFDVMGGWRDKYRAIGSAEPVKGIGHNGLNYHFSIGPSVDCTGEFDGNSFGDVRELKRLMLRDEKQLARNFVRQLIVYATGAPIQFSDRPQIEQLLTRTRAKDYGIRTLIMKSCRARCS